MLTIYGDYAIAKKHVKEETLSTVKTGDDAKPTYTREVDRVPDGFAPGHEVERQDMGHTGEALKAIGHIVKEGAKLVKDLANPLFRKKSPKTWIDIQNGWDQVR